MRDEEYDPFGLMAELARNNYAAIKPMSDEVRVRVYVSDDNDAGGELTAILRRHGYSPKYPKVYDGEDFVFRVDCEPILWNTSAMKNCPEPSWWSDLSDDVLPDRDQDGQ